MVDVFQFPTKTTISRFLLGAEVEALHKLLMLRLMREHLMPIIITECAVECGTVSYYMYL